MREDGGGGVHAAGPHVRMNEEAVGRGGGWVRQGQTGTSAWSWRWKAEDGRGTPSVADGCGLGRPVAQGQEGTGRGL